MRVLVNWKLIKIDEPVAQMPSDKFYTRRERDDAEWISTVRTHKLYCVHCEQYIDENKFLLNRHSFCYFICCPRSSVQAVNKAFGIHVVSSAVYTDSTSTLFTGKSQQYYIRMKVNVTEPFLFAEHSLQDDFSLYIYILWYSNVSYCNSVQYMSVCVIVIAREATKNIGI